MGSEHMLFFTLAAVFIALRQPVALAQDFPAADQYEYPNNPETGEYESTANEPQTNVSVIPTSHTAVTLPPAAVPPEGIMFENKSPENVQTFQVPGVGMPIDQSQQVIRFLFW